MLVPPDVISSSSSSNSSISGPGSSPPLLTINSKLNYHLNKFCNERVMYRRATISKSVREVVKVVQDILKEVEVQEPRFISSLNEVQGHHSSHSHSMNSNSSDSFFEGLQIHSPTEFEVILYLNQMGVFNFVDDGSIPGCAVLKLSDGRKRSMSLWVEFITASGYLSARKIRSRFQTLVAQACDKSIYRDLVKMIPETSEVKLRIRERFIVQITPAFRCSGLWPRSASHWPVPSSSWPSPQSIAEVKSEGFDLLSKEIPAAANSSKSASNQNSSSSSLLSSISSSSSSSSSHLMAGLMNQNNPNQNGNSSSSSSSSSMEGDAWVLSFFEAENRLIASCPGRKKVLSILKTLRDRHLDLPGNPITCYILKTLVLYESEKHARDADWDELVLGDRIIGALIQLISCLQCRRCPHYFLPNLDLFKGKSSSSLENAAKQTWRLARELMTNPKSFDKL